MKRMNKEELEKFHAAGQRWFDRQDAGVHKKKISRHLQAKMQSGYSESHVSTVLDFAEDVALRQASEKEREREIKRDVQNKTVEKMLERWRKEDQ